VPNPLDIRRAPVHSVCHARMIPYRCDSCTMIDTTRRVAISLLIRLVENIFRLIGNLAALCRAGHVSGVLNHRDTSP
jgi:hypothetical protein